MHWAKQRKYGRSWDNEILVAKNRQQIFGRPRHGPVVLNITLFYCGRVSMDKDNLVSACKPVIDGLTDNGLIYDDSPDIVRAVDVQESKVPRKDAGTLVVISPATLPGRSR